MKNLVLIGSIAIMTSCGTNNNSKIKSNNSAMTSKIELIGVDALKMVAGLRTLGAIETFSLESIISHAGNELKVTDLYCVRDRPSVVGRGPDKIVYCTRTLTSSGSSFTGTTHAPGLAEIMQLLASNGGRVNPGINADAVAAKSIVCNIRENEANRAEARCVFTKQDIIRN